jgi:hypothetical protein
MGGFKSWINRIKYAEKKQRPSIGMRRDERIGERLISGSKFG